MRIVCVHGWGLGPSLWDGLATLLPGHDVATVDLGFLDPSPHSATDLPADALLIGHSLGFAWILRHMTRPPKGLIAINGFTRFTAEPGFPGVPPRVLARMREAFTADPAGVLSDFLARCGASSAPPRFDGQRLGEGLRHLAEWDVRPALSAVGCPLLALAGRDDPIVPQPMTEASFAALAEIVWADGGGHLLPLTHPSWCAARIAAFAEGLS